MHVADSDPFTHPQAHSGAVRSWEQADTQQLVRLLDGGLNESEWEVLEFLANQPERSFTVQELAERGVERTTVEQTLQDVSAHCDSLGFEELITVDDSGISLRAELAPLTLEALQVQYEQQQG